jgi:hypothetical protein
MDLVESTVLQLVCALGVGNRPLQIIANQADGSAKQFDPRRRGHLGWPYFGEVQICTRRAPHCLASARLKHCATEPLRAANTCTTKSRYT